METQTSSGAFGVLVGSSPEVSPAQAERLVAEHYGVIGDASRVAGERDDNFVISASAERYFLKVVHAEELPNVTDLGTQVLRWLERYPDLPVQTLVSSKAGAPQANVQIGGVSRALRLTSYLEGRLLRNVPTSVELRTNLGAILARLGLALAPFAHPAADRILLWDIRHAGETRQMLEDLSDIPDWEMLRDCLDRFEQVTCPELRQLRTQVVHHDMSADNILIGDDGTTVSGILDFGDVVRTQLVNDVAVAATSQLADGVDPMAPVLDLVGGYHRVVPLCPEELRLIYDLVRVRTVIRIVISEWRVRRFPENGAYILRNTPQAWDHLRNMPVRVGEAIYERLAAVCATS